MAINYLIVALAISPPAERTRRSFVLWLVLIIIDAYVSPRDFSAGLPPICKLYLRSLVPAIISAEASRFGRHSSFFLLTAGLCPTPMVLRRIVGSLFVFWLGFNTYTTRLCCRCTFTTDEICLVTWGHFPSVYLVSTSSRHKSGLVTIQSRYYGGYK